MNIRMTTTVDWRGEAVLARVRAGGQAASVDAARALLAESNKTVPYETGRLKNSGRVDEAIGTSAGMSGGRGGSVGARVSYSTPYAARLHENPQFNFRGKGRGKWLQLAVQEMAGRIAGILAEGIRKRIRT